MRNLFFVFVLLSLSSSAQKTKVPPKKYPSLLWEITRPGQQKPSYLFGTMHVSSKMVFHLSDSFYLGLRRADVVALETDMATWQDDFSRYDLQGESLQSVFNRGGGAPGDFMTKGTLQYPSYDELVEAALYSSPSMINNFLYRSGSAKSSDFEEDTYLDMHIFQTGKKWGKKVVGVENFDQSMQLMKEAYRDAAKTKDFRKKNFEYDEDFSYAKLEDAYRSGNLDLLDTINKVNSSSAAFDEKFMYRRNEIQAHSIDSIIRSGSALFVGVGAAHLPGQRGVIELLRRQGYRLRPVMMSERDSHQKDEVEKIRVPVSFATQKAPDGFFTVSMPGKWYDFNANGSQLQYADMSNGSYYMVTRINTNALVWGHDEKTVLHKVDSVIYENTPGKILEKTSITRNGYKGYEVKNRTRRGDYQRYNIFVTPFEILLFKMSGNGDYVNEGKEADTFFNSIQLRENKTSWSAWKPASGGFQVDMPQEPLVLNQGNWQYMAYDAAKKTGYEVLRTEIHNYDFVEEDSFDLRLMEESFASSDFIDKKISSKFLKQGGYPALDTRYKYKDGSVAAVRFLIQGPHYYTLIAHAQTEQADFSRFMNSFRILPFVYASPLALRDTSLYYSVSSPVSLYKTAKISMMPEELFRYGMMNNDDDDGESDNYKDRVITADSTGEKIYVSFMKPSRYYFQTDSTVDKDTLHFKTDKINWTYRSRKLKKAPAGQYEVLDYVLGDPGSSRMVYGKLFSRDGISYRLESEGDTLSKPSSFIATFYNSFTPSDTVKGTNVKERKSALFFADFNSSDTILHKRAVKNVRSVDFAEDDLPAFKKTLQSLTWKEKKYLDVKNDMVASLADFKSKASSDLLKEIYFAAGDTLELQHAALNALLLQANQYSFDVFKSIMTTDPPVLGLGSGSDEYATSVIPGWHSVIRSGKYNYGGNFMNRLYDSVQLTTTIFKDLLPLININDYEQPMLELTGRLIDSNLVSAKDYASYLPGLLIEAKQLWKKQVISEKSRSISKAQKTDEDDDNIYGKLPSDFGNEQLSLYATLLLPFYDQNPAIPQLINQMLASNDKQLKYSTALLLVRNNRKVPDTMLRYFAGLDEFRYDLYTDLKNAKKFDLFPVAGKDFIALAKARLLEGTASYNRPDTVVFLDKLPAKAGTKNGFVYFFKYKADKDDNSWKIGTVGLVPASKDFEFELTEADGDEDLYDFTGLTETKLDNEEPLRQQLETVLKKLVYSKRNSAAQFYSNDSDRGRFNFMERD